MVINKFWSKRLENDIKELKKSAWNTLLLILYKYGFDKEIRYRGLSTLDIAIQIINNKKLWSKLDNNERYYISGLLGKQKGVNE